MTFQSDDAETETTSRSQWTLDHTVDIERTHHNVAPSVVPPETDPAEDVHIWDTWLLRDRHGEVVSIDGWQVLFSLSAPADLLPGKRHDVAEIRYFYSSDGEEWHDGGPVFADDALGQRQWAGSALYDDGDLYLYYTASGDDDADELTYTQRIAVGHGGDITVSDDGVTLSGPWTHEILLEPDGEWYETEEQSEGMIYTFRDPWFFEDPETGRTNLLFEANAPVHEDSDVADATEHHEFNGAVGIAVSPTGDPLDWELRPPLLDAIGVNQELERPHIVRQDGYYYLFISSHMHTFAPGIDGYDALYGFVAESLRGDYEPLNGSGLVVTNPDETPYQSYSWMAFPHDEGILVQSFCNYHDFTGASLDEIAELPEDQQLGRFGGTLAPTICLDVDGASTSVRGTLAHWYIPTKDASLPDLERDDAPAGSVDSIERDESSQIDESDRDDRSVGERTRNSSSYY